MTRSLAARPCLVSLASLAACAALSALTACRAEPDRPFCEPGLACAAASPEHCAAGPEASRHGRDVFTDGTCSARDDHACAAASLTCALWGQCHARPASLAAPAGCPAADRDRDFLASRDARCTAGTCVALGDDCEHAGVCALEGRCHAADGVCVANDANRCAASELCRETGACSLSGGRCRATRAADCERSAGCADWSRCAYVDGDCAPCARAPGCRAEGLCGQSGRRCAATLARHCEASQACQSEGRCKPFRGGCVR